MPADRDPQADVIEELDFDPAVDAAHIGVTAKDGVVTLSGHVGSYAEKLAAEAAVRRVKGVLAIAEGERSLDLVAWLPAGRDRPSFCRPMVALVADHRRPATCSAAPQCASRAMPR